MHESTVLNLNTNGTIGEMTEIIMSDFKSTTTLFGSTRFLDLFS